ncbi:hypothetical protein DFP72DRAFT_531537 [Ephemerocybe angulata]|uniref:Uncharacterized protein n=1 Tax=Ephemerocybe angulata TaxID=980116 RepID=A0A8H6IEA1_9AGAR|nr:hypothetical protein DFP72DRAFT_531537 [Tulosesus angulatus]
MHAYLLHTYTTIVVLLTCYCTEYPFTMLSRLTDRAKASCTDRLTSSSQELALWRQKSRKKSQVPLSNVGCRVCTTSLSTWHLLPNRRDTGEAHSWRDMTGIGSGWAGPARYRLVSTATDEGGWAIRTPSGYVAMVATWLGWARKGWAGRQ